MQVKDNPDVLYHWEQQKLKRQIWSSSPTGPDKQGITSTIRQWNTPFRELEVSKLHWDKEGDWGMDDILYRDEVIFNLSREQGLEELIGYLFQASIDGYSIRYVSSDPNIGIYLQITQCGSSNIDDEVLTTIMEVVKRGNFDIC